MAGMTNRGKYTLLNYYFRRQGTLPTNFYLALCTNAVAPSADINVLGDLTQIAVGNGYTDGGYQLNPNTTDFDVLSEDDGNDRAAMQLKNIVFNASGGSIPASGNGARWAILTDDNGTIASRIVFFYWDLVSDRSVSDGQPLTLQDCEARLTE